MNHAHQTVTLRMRNDRTPAAIARLDLGPVEVERMARQAERMGLPRHADPSIAGLLAAARLQPDIPEELYAALAAVLAGIDAIASNAHGVSRH